MGEGKGRAGAAEHDVWSHSQWTSAIAEKSFSIFFLAPFQKKKIQRPEVETSFISQILFPVWKIHSLSYVPSRLHRTLPSNHSSIHFLYIYPPYARWNVEEGDGTKRHISTTEERKSSRILVLVASYATFYTNCALPPLWFVCVLIQLHLLCSFIRTWFPALWFLVFDFVGPPPNQYCGFWDEQSEDSTVKQILPEKLCLHQDLHSRYLLLFI